MSPSEFDALHCGSHCAVDLFNNPTADVSLSRWLEMDWEKNQELSPTFQILVCGLIACHPVLVANSASILSTLQTKTENESTDIQEQLWLAFLQDKTWFVSTFKSFLLGLT